MKAMRYWMFTCVLLLVPLSGRANSIYKILTYRSVGGVEALPDGRWVAFTATAADLDENTMNSDVWVVELQTGRSYQLTRGAKRDNDPKWSPDGSRLAFLSDRSGKVNIWLISPDGGEAEAGTKFEKLSVASYEWLPDGSGFLFAAADPATPEEEKRKKDKNDPILVDKDFKYARLYQFKLGEKEPAKLTKEDYHVSSFDVSPDGKWVAFSAQPTPKVPDFTKSDVKLLELATGTVRSVVARPGGDLGPRFSPDGQWIAFVSSFGRNDWTGNGNLWVVKPDGSGLRNVSDSFDEDVSSAYVRWAADGQWIYFAASQGVSDRLFRVQVSSGRWEAVTDHDKMKVCHAYSLGPKGSVLMALSDPQAPAEVYRVDASGGLRKLTSVNAAFENTAPTTELLRYKSPDGFDLEGLVVKPRTYEKGKRYPLLVVVHGGPDDVFSYGFAPRRSAAPLHAFAEQGYVIFMPNPRGSGGYGEKFRQANFKDWGYGDYRDIMQGVDELIKTGVADPERMGVMGWSYGGYMTSWIVSQTDRFQAASMGAGLSNLFSMYGTNDIPEALEAYFGAKPWEDTALYLKHSAINFVANAKTPTLIQHGQEDRRVPISQAQEFYQALKDVGVPVEMVVYPRQPHGIQEPRLIKDSLERNLAWFNKWVLGLEPPAEKPEKKDGKPAE